MIKLLRWPLIAMLAILCVALVQWMTQRGSGVPAPAFAMERPAYGPTTYADLLAASNQRLELSLARVELAPNEWLPHAGAGAAALSLFRLTGKIAYLDMAEAKIAAVRTLAPKPSGVPELRAELAMVRHDLAGASRELDILALASVTPEKPTLSEAAAMRGDLALYAGDHVEAARLYREATQQEPHVGVALRIANLQRVSGEFDAAIATLAEATRAEKLTPVVLVEHRAPNWHDRQRARRLCRCAGLVRPGRRPVFRTLAHRTLPGRSTPCKGRGQRAIAELERVARDHNRPEAMDMLALVWRVRGDNTRSRAWLKKSGAIWQEWTAKYPAAFAAHAAEHELVFGDPAKALRLAAINAQGPAVWRDPAAARTGAHGE